MVQFSYALFFIYIYIRIFSIKNVEAEICEILRIV